MSCRTPGVPVLHCLGEFAQTHVHWVSDAIQPPHPVSPSSSPALNLSHHHCLFQLVGSFYQGPKCWGFRFSISSSNENSGPLSFRIDCFDFLALQGTLKSILQHHKSSVLWCSAFFMVQLSHPYMTTGKTIALTRQTFIGKIMSLFFNTLSQFLTCCLGLS